MLLYIPSIKYISTTWLQPDVCNAKLQGYKDASFLLGWHDAGLTWQSYNTKKFNNLQPFFSSWVKRG